MPTGLRNFAIVLAIAALIVLVPGGGTGANFAMQAIYLVFLAVAGWFAYTMYRDRRAQLFSLGAARRAILYAAIGVVVLTLTAESRLWVSTDGKIVFVLLLVGACYAVFAVMWSVRRY